MAPVTKAKGMKEKAKYQSGQKQVSILSAKSPFAFVEAYKMLRTNLDFVSSASGAKSILITSAIPEESKSTTAINLALTLAGDGHSVIVVECDLRKPTMRRYVKLARGVKGLSAILSGNAELDECINELPERGIHVIHSGAIPPNPSELLNSERMRSLVEALKERYDYVLLDAPPVTVVTDAAVVGRMADGALLVIRSRFAPARTVRLAKQRLDTVNVRVLGVVLTRFDMKKSGWRSGYDYDGYTYGYGYARKQK